MEAVQEIVLGCIENNRRSQKDFYKMFYDYAMSICLRYANNKDDASSVLNEGFFKIFKQIKHYDLSKPISPWIRKIMINTSIDFYRHNFKYENYLEIDEYQNVVRSEDFIYNKLSYEDLLILIQSLSPAYRTVFNLYAIEGFSHLEIAEQLNISVGTSKSNLFKARLKLMEKMKILEKIDSNSIM